MKKPAKIIIPTVVVFLNAAIVIFPAASISAARDGVRLWLDCVLPALLPFVIGVNVLTALGVVKRVGELIEPFTRKVLGVGGEGGFALAAGLISGYPVGAKITSELRQNGGLSRAHAKRLISFANNAGPLFIIGAVGAGMFQNAKIGYFLLLTHYIGAMAAGTLLRPFSAKNGVKAIKRDFAAATPTSDPSEKLGSMLGKSVVSAMETMLQIGGFIVLFRVITAVTDVCGITALLSSPFNGATTAGGVIAGFIEITAGCAKLAESGEIKNAVVAAAGIIGWGGLSVHAQALSFISKTDIPASFYIAAKALHGAASAAATLILYPLFENMLEQRVIQTYAPQTFLSNLTGGAAAFAALAAVLLVFVFFRKTIKP